MDWDDANDRDMINGSAEDDDVMQQTSLDNHFFVTIYIFFYEIYVM